MITRAPKSAASLLALGIVLLLPPLALIFARQITLWGIPLPVFYIFGLWLVLIIGIWLISRQLKSDSTG
ncbi:hypothetical protein [Thiohalophilus sp.]|uniref:hypothetical protein n=1 Tax=Thiohalophilus sp. TaxID=3028392 RepID=UPI002ACEFB1D|nr:hypothetical protein [Thiohalophilus sp.]MDZ7662725.1 hypothetical protein [Thiohalophilus sp.]